MVAINNGKNPNRGSEWVRTHMLQALFNAFNIAQKYNDKEAHNECSAILFNMTGATKEDLIEWCRREIAKRDANNG